MKNSKKTEKAIESIINKKPTKAKKEKDQSSLAENVKRAVNYGSVSKEGSVSKFKNLINTDDFCDLVKEVSEGKIKSRREAKEVAHFVIDAISKALIKGNGIVLKGNLHHLGTLHLRTQKAISRKNLLTKEFIEVPEKVTFRLRPTKKDVGGLKAVRNELSEVFKKLIKK